MRDLARRTALADVLDILGPEEKIGKPVGSDLRAGIPSLPVVLSGEEVVRFLEWQEVNARIGWFINDLERHPFSYCGFSLLSRVMLWHPFVVHDGPVFGDVGIAEPTCHRCLSRVDDLLDDPNE